MKIDFTPEQEAEFKAWEKTVKKGIKAKMAVCEALYNIRKTEYYRIIAGYKTWDEYLSERWGFSRQYAANLIFTFNLNKRLSTTVDIPPSQAKVFQKLPPEEQDRIAAMAQNGQDVREEIFQTEKRCKSDYLIIKGHVSKIRVLLTTTQTESARIIAELEELEKDIATFKEQHRKRIALLQQDTEFDKAA